MREGWCNDRYLVLFEEHEIEEATRAYLGSGSLTGYTVVGLDSWDDLIVERCWRQVQGAVRAH